MGGQTASPFVTSRDGLGNRLDQLVVRIIIKLLGAPSIYTEAQHQW